MGLHTSIITVCIKSVREPSVNIPLKYVGSPFLEFAETKRLYDPFPIMYELEVIINFPFKPSEVRIKSSAVKSQTFDLVVARAVSLKLSTSIYL